MRLFIKARAVPVGTISTHGGRKMKKTSQGWVPVKSPNMRTLSDEAYIDSIINMYKRQPKGRGGSKSIKSKRDLDIILTKTKVAFVSAGRNPEIPADVKLSDADIGARDESLKSDLKQLGYLYTPALGKYGGLPENSLIVMAHGADSSDMTKLGTKYNQDSVLTVNNGHSELVMTTGDQKGEVTMAGDGYEMVPAADDFFTEIKVGGASLKFTMLLDEIQKAINKIRYFIKAKKMPIGTISHVRKKVAEGKCVPVKKGTSGKKKSVPLPSGKEDNPDLVVARAEWERANKVKIKILKELEGLEPKKISNPWKGIKDKTWEQLGYTSPERMSQKYGPKAGKYTVMHTLVSEAYKSINTEDYNLSKTENWTRMLVDEYKALHKNIPNLPITFKEFRAINTRMHKKGATGMDVWDWTADKIKMKWDKWEGKKK